ncbi:hypothetical protein K8T06_10560, partial [bacterium]|nr:hypothetical protein [bacterium]
MKKIECNEFRRIWLETDNPTDLEIRIAGEHLKECFDCQALELESESRFLLRDFETPGIGNAYFDNLIEGIHLEEKEHEMAVQRIKTRVKDQIQRKLKTELASDKMSLEKHWHAVLSFFEDITERVIPCVFEPALAYSV